jgi:hypothetical protein
MKTGKLFLLTAALVMAAGLVGSAMAQGRIAPAGAIEIRPIPATTKLNAIEITDGTIGYDSNAKQEMTYGYSFLGRTSGEFPGSFSLFMNCTPAIPMLGDASEVTGGSWALPVYMTGAKGGLVYVGSLYGTISNGSMNWDKLGNADVNLVLNVDGGTQNWAGATGSVTFVGTLLHSQSSDVTTLTGELVFSVKY